MAFPFTEVALWGEGWTSADGNAEVPFRLNIGHSEDSSPKMASTGKELEVLF